jgi:hypothetical protein
MFDIYKETDLLVEDLKKAKYEEYSKSIIEAKLSGSVASEILGLVLEQLERHTDEIKQEDIYLMEKIKRLEIEIKKVLKFE